MPGSWFLAFNKQLIHFIIFRHAERKSNAGDKKYMRGQYPLALDLYSEAIRLCPMNAVYHTNRSTCLFTMGDYKNALKDSRNAVALDDKSEIDYDSIIKCCFILNDMAGAEQAVNKLIEIGSNCDIRGRFKKRWEQLWSTNEMATQCSEKKDLPNDGWYIMEPRIDD